MANAKKCDRCGRYYSNDDHECNLSYHDLCYYEKFYVDDEYIEPITVRFTDKIGSYYTFELCPDCMREVISFIATKNEEE